MAAERLAYPERGPNELRMLVLPPTHADGVAIEKVLADGMIGSAILSGMSQICNALGAGAGGVILSEEAVLADSPLLLAWLASQPMWSETPVIVLAKFGRESAVFTRVVSELGNVSVVE